MNLKFFLIFFFIIFVTIISCNGTEEIDPDPKVVGGTLTTINKMKYLVYLRRYGKFACGGALVNSRYVVTAAHCVAGYPTSSLTITGGTTYLTQGGISRRVSRYFTTGTFSRETMNADIAVLKLRAPLQGANISTIPLCSQRLKVGAKLRVAGWGLTSETSTSPSTQVRTAIVRLRSRQSCRRSYAGFGITNSMMCASARNTDTCSGDSGGPVVFKGQLCGVVSWGVGCARDGYPGVYTVINRVKKFIKRSLNK